MTIQIRGSKIKITKYFLDKKNTLKYVGIFIVMSKGILFLFWRNNVQVWTRIKSFEIHYLENVQETKRFNLL